MIAVFAEVRADLVSTVGTADERREANLVPGRGGTQRQGDFPIELLVPLHTAEDNDVGMKE